MSDDDRGLAFEYAYKDLSNRRSRRDTSSSPVLASSELIIGPTKTKFTSVPQLCLSEGGRHTLIRISTKHKPGDHDIGIGMCRVAGINMLVIISLQVFRMNSND